MHPAIIIGTVRSLWTWLWGRYDVPQNVFLVSVSYLSFLPIIFICFMSTAVVNKRICRPIRNYLCRFWFILCQQFMNYRVHKMFIAIIG